MRQLIRITYEFEVRGDGVIPDGTYRATAFWPETTSKAEFAIKKFEDGKWIMVGSRKASDYSSTSAQVAMWHFYKEKTG